MIKKLLTALVFCSAIGFAQNEKSIKGMAYSIPAPGHPGAMTAAKTTSASCDTIYNFNLGAPSTTISVFSVNTTSNCTTGGYVAGNNCYGDLEKANYFTGTTYSAMVTPSVTGCIVFFFKTPTGIGTKGAAAHTVGLKLYGGTMASGPTSTMGVTSLSFSAINAAFSATTSLGSVQFSFPTGIPLSGSGFFTSVVLPANTGDTLAIFQQASAPADAAWEMDYISAWYNMKTNWGGTTNFQLCMFPVIGCSEFVGIKNNDLDPFFNVVPNPSAGLFSLVSGLSGLSFDLRVTNAIGQVVTERKAISGGSVSDIDLSNYPGGIYFATITAGSNSITKKLVLNK